MNTQEPPAEKFARRLFSKTAEFMERVSPATPLTSEIMADAYALCREGGGAGLAAGRSYKVLFTAALFLTCRKEGIPLKLKELTGFAVLLDSEVWSACKAFITQKVTALPPLDLSSFVGRYCHGLQIGHLTSEVTSLVIRAQERFVGKNPHTIIAGCIYFEVRMHKESVTQQQIAQETGVAASTFRPIYQSIRNHKL
jgi:transcription initiation factor TFIIB